MTDAADVVDDPTAMARYLTDWRRLYHGRAALVLRPAATAEVTAIPSRQGATVLCLRHRTTP